MATTQVVVVVVVLFCFVGFSFCGQVTWGPHCVSQYDCGDGYNWYNELNWIEDRMPVAGDDVVITSGCSQNILIGNENYVGNLSHLNSWTIGGNCTVIKGGNSVLGNVAPAFIQAGGTLVSGGGDIAPISNISIEAGGTLKQTSGRIISSTAFLVVKVNGLFMVTGGSANRIMLEVEVYGTFSIDGYGPGIRGTLWITENGMLVAPAAGSIWTAEGNGTVRNSGLMLINFTDGSLDFSGYSNAGEYITLENEGLIHVLQGELEFRNDAIFLQSPQGEVNISINGSISTGGSSTSEVSGIITGEGPFHHFSRDLFAEDMAVSGVLRLGGGNLMGRVNVTGEMFVESSSGPKLIDATLMIDDGATFELKYCNGLYLDGSTTITIARGGLMLVHEDACDFYTGDSGNPDEPVYFRNFGTVTVTNDTNGWFQFDKYTYGHPLVVENSGLLDIMGSCEASYGVQVLGSGKIDLNNGGSFFVAEQPWIFEGELVGSGIVQIGYSSQSCGFVNSGLIAPGSLLENGQIEFITSSFCQSSEGEIQVNVSENCNFDQIVVEANALVNGSFNGYVSDVPFTNGIGFPVLISGGSTDGTFLATSCGCEVAEFRFSKENCGLFITNAPEGTNASVFCAEISQEANCAVHVPSQTFSSECCAEDSLSRTAIPYFFALFGFAALFT